MKFLLIAWAVGIVWVFLPTVIEIHIQRKAYNKGVCPHCGAKLRYYDVDAEGLCGYICDECLYQTWVDPIFVDVAIDEEA